LSILEPLEHPNVAAVLDGATYKLVGDGPAGVALAQQVKGPPVDASDHRQLRLRLISNPPGGVADCALHVTIETADAEIGPWWPLHTFQAVPSEHSSTRHRQRAVITPGTYVRAAWYWSATGSNDALVRRGPKTWTFALTAEALR
jgi:hypothetical protein